MAKIKLFYGGERLNSDNKLWQIFYRPDGKIEGYWKGIKGVYIGECYWAEGQYGDKKLSLKRRPESAGEEVHKDQDKWRSQSWADKAIHKERQIKNRADKMKGLLKDVENIKNFTKGLTFAQKRAFVEWIIDECEREEREKMNRAFNIRIERVNKALAKATKEKKK